MTIAVTGATGHLGRLSIAALKARGANPVALARDPAKAADLGVEVRAFDYTAPDPAALKGIDTLVLISSNDFTDRAGQHQKAIAAGLKAVTKSNVDASAIVEGLLTMHDDVCVDADLSRQPVTAGNPDAPGFVAKDAE